MEYEMKKGKEITGQTETRECKNKFTYKSPGCCCGASGAMGDGALG